MDFAVRSDCLLTNPPPSADSHSSQISTVCKLVADFSRRRPRGRVPGRTSSIDVGRGPATRRSPRPKQNGRRKSAARFVRRSTATDLVAAGLQLLRGLLLCSFFLVAFLAAFFLAAFFLAGAFFFAAFFFVAFLAAFFFAGAFFFVAFFFVAFLAAFFFVVFWRPSSSSLPSSSSPSWRPSSSRGPSSSSPSSSSLSLAAFFFGARGRGRRRHHGHHVCHHLWFLLSELP